jgi:hypothetical protein
VSNQSRASIVERIIFAKGFSDKMHVFSADFSDGDFVKTCDDVNGAALVDFRELNLLNNIIIISYSRRTR